MQRDVEMHAPLLTERTGIRLGRGESIRQIQITDQ